MGVICNVCTLSPDNYPAPNRNMIQTQSMEFDNVNRNSSIV